MNNQEYSRDFKGVWIPKDIWLNSNLTLVEKVVYVEIQSLDNPPSHCFAGNEYFAEFCDCSERKISEVIKKLCDLKMIEIVSFDGRNRTIRVAKHSNESRKICEADTQKSNANNITNNKKNNTTNNKNPLYPPYGEITYFPDTELDSKFKEWLEYRREIKKPYKSDKSIAMLIKQMQDSGLNNDELIECFNKSMANSYQGVFFVKNKKKTTIDWSKV